MALGSSVIVRTSQEMTRQVLEYCGQSTCPLYFGKGVKIDYCVDQCRLVSCPEGKGLEDWEREVHMERYNKRMEQNNKKEKMKGR